MYNQVFKQHYITGKDIIHMDYIYNPITIRLAVPADAPDMAQVHMRSWEAAYNDIVPAEYIREKNAGRPALWQRIISSENTAHYIIQRDRQTVGIMTIVPTPQDGDADCETCELEGIYLHPDYYRMGIGTQAMDFAFDTARRWGKTVMTLWVFAENTNAIKFYEKCGFKSDGKTKTYNMGKTMNCIRMKRALEEEPM